MPLDPPAWWYQGHPPLWAWALWPVSRIYGALAQHRFRGTKPYRSQLPVICVGNFTLGGAGKTPVALALARLVQASGRKPAFLTRGYGGREKGPHLVNLAEDDAMRVGDEPLLLGRAAPTIVSRDRALGAKTIEALGADIIIMDDGFQNPSLHKDLSLIAVDGGVGLGSGRVFPLGPLRAPLAFQMTMARVAVMIGAEEPSPQLLAAFQNFLILRASIAPDPAIDLLGRRFIAYCGIGRPAKFFETLDQAGAILIDRIAFPDHHAFSEAEAETVLRAAKQAGAQLITTEKDLARLAGKAGALGELYKASLPLPIALKFMGDAEADLQQLVLDVMASRRPESSAH